MIQGFAPIIPKQPRVLILGSMPSVASLAEQQYYGHKQNAFWWIIARLNGYSINDHTAIDYSKKLDWLEALDVALWDVFAQCEREGSLDSAIQLQTADVNDFNALFNDYPSIKAVFLNGKTAEKQFKKSLNDTFTKQLTILALPSTSPANAMLSKEQKLELWQAAFEEL